MFVPCPHCGFLVALIVRADGAPQRCPRCDGLVQSPIDEGDTTPGDSDTAHVPDTIETSTYAGAPEESTVAPPAAAPDAASEAVATDVASVEEPAHTQVPDADATRTYEEAIAAVTVGTPANRSRRAARPRRKGAPSFARHSTPSAPARAHWGWHAGVAGLTLLLALQLLLAQRHELAADPRWRPLVAGACTVLRCEVPAWREPAAFTMLQRSVRPKSGQTGVLTVEASFRNDAHWSQPWPTLVLSLADVDGRQVGVRAFTPDEYRAAHGGADRLLPGQSANVALEVVEPAPRIVAFTFDFR